MPFACFRSFVLDLAKGNADTMPTSRPERVVATGVGPRATLVRTNLQAMYPHVKRAWVEEARLTAILGNRSSTLKSLRSGICCYITFNGVNQTNNSDVRQARLSHDIFLLRRMWQQGRSILPAEARHIASLVTAFSQQGHLWQLLEPRSHGVHSGEAAD